MDGGPKLIRWLLLIYAFILMDKKNPAFVDIFKILRSKQYPIAKCGKLNTRRIVYLSLEYYRTKRRFSPIQCSILKRVAGG
jgi:hypothetical protein